MILNCVCCCKKRDDIIEVTYFLCFVTSLLLLLVDYYNIIRIKKNKNLLLGLTQQQPQQRFPVQACTLPVKYEKDNFDRAENPGAVCWGGLGRGE